MQEKKKEENFKAARKCEKNRPKSMNGCAVHWKVQVFMPGLFDSSTLPYDIKQANLRPVLPFFKSILALQFTVNFRGKLFDERLTRRWQVHCEKHYGGNFII